MLDLGHMIGNAGCKTQDLGHNIWDAVFGTQDVGMQDLGHRIWDTGSEAYASRPWRLGIGSTGWELPGIRSHRHEFQRKTRSNRNAHTHTHGAHITTIVLYVFASESYK